MHPAMSRADEPLTTCLFRRRNAGSTSKNCLFADDFEELPNWDVWLLDLVWEERGDENVDIFPEGELDSIDGVMSGF